jgi:hypothetical protein
MGMLGLHLENPSDERSVIIGLGASAASQRRSRPEQKGASLHHVAKIEKLLKWLRTGFNTLTMPEAGEKFVIKLRCAFGSIARP